MFLHTLTCTTIISLIHAGVPIGASSWRVEDSCSTDRINRIVDILILEIESIRIQVIIK